MKAFVRQGQAEGNTGLIDHSLPAANAVRNLVDVVVAPPLVPRRQRRNLLWHDLVARAFRDRITSIDKQVIVLELRLAEASFQTAGEIICGVGGNVGAV